MAVVKMPHMQLAVNLLQSMAHTDNAGGYQSQLIPWDHGDNISPSASLVGWLWSWVAPFWLPILPQHALQDEVVWIRYLRQFNCFIQICQTCKGLKFMTQWIQFDSCH